MAVKLSPFGPNPQWVDTNGDPASGYKLFFYAAGSSTKQNTYTDSSGNTANSNPIVLNALGQPENAIWFTEGLEYTAVLSPPDDTDPPTSSIWTRDDLSGINDAAISVDQWVAPGVTPTYVSATQFTVPGDQTSSFTVNRRIKATVTAGTVYGYISVSAYTSLTTVTVVLDSGNLDDGLSAVSLGLITPTNTSLPLNNLIATTALQDGAVATAKIASEAVTPAKLSDDAFIIILGDSKNLVITNNSGTPNSQLDIDADEIVLKDSDGRAYLAESVNLTVDITASGANGLSTGSESPSTWYYAWVLWNGTTVAGILDPSISSPTLPSGYTHRALVGAIYNDGSSNFIKIYQNGNKVRRAQLTVSTTVPTTSYVSVSLTAAVPANAKRVIGQEGFQMGASVTATYYISPASSDDLAKSNTYTTGGSTAATQPRHFDEPLITAQTIYNKRTGTAPGAYNMHVNGWEY
jgi:hypothetical protein